MVAHAKGRQQTLMRMVAHMKRAKKSLLLRVANKIKN